METTAPSFLLRLVVIVTTCVQLGYCAFHHSDSRKKKYVDKYNTFYSDSGYDSDYKYKVDSKGVSARQTAIKKLLGSHDAKIPPDFELDVPTNVTVQVHIVSFDSINEATMDYSMSIFLRQTWKDPRMTYEKLAGVDMLELDARAMAKVWVPDLFFVNEKRADFHDVTVPNKLMQVFPDGRILYSSRISMTLSCDMNLRKFPFDEQGCSLMMESYSYSTKNIVFTWHTNPVEMRAGLVLPQFEITKNYSSDCTKEYKETGSNYTCIRVDFHLVRNYGYYVAQVYLPSILIVCLSWVSFWLDIDAVPARISLGLLTVLTMTTQSSNARAHLPRVSYIKAIDLWMASCMMFVFSALIEYSYVNVHSRVEKRRMSQCPSAQGGLKLGASSNNHGNFDDSEAKPKRLFSRTTIGRAKARRLDKISRWVFPIVFIVFNIVYWSFYMIWEVELPHYSH